MKILLVTGCIFWALFDTHIVFGVRILDTCSPNGSKIAKYEFKDDRWFQIGQLYAFCMQVYILCCHAKIFINLNFALNFNATKIHIKLIYIFLISFI